MRAASSGDGELVIHRHQSVILLDSRLIAGPVGLHPVGIEGAIHLHPPHAVVWNLDFALFLKIEGGVNHCGNC